MSMTGGTGNLYGICRSDPCQCVPVQAGAYTTKLLSTGSSVHCDDVVIDGCGLPRQVILLADLVGPIRDRSKCPGGQAGNLQALASVAVMMLNLASFLFSLSFSATTTFRQSATPASMAGRRLEAAGGPSA